MFSALPFIAPQDGHAFWHTFSEHTSPNARPHHHGQHHHQQQQQQHGQNFSAHQATSRPGRTTNHALAQLRRDEAFITQRKLNIRRLGATWIRPPGVPKTYQAMMDDALEREEAERLAEREAAMAEMQDGETEATGLGTEPPFGAPAGEVEEVGERDLDEDVPEAEGGDYEDDDEEEEVGVEGEEDDVGALDEVEAASLVSGAVRDEETGELMEPETDDHHQVLADRDLDEDVPEAGSYQHTDSEVEDFSDDDSDDGRYELPSTNEQNLPAAPQVLGNIPHTPSQQISSTSGGGVTRSGSPRRPQRQVPHAATSSSPTSQESPRTPRRTRRARW